MGDDFDELFNIEENRREHRQKESTDTYARMVKGATTQLIANVLKITKDLS